MLLKLRSPGSKGAWRHLPKDGKGEVQIVTTDGKKVCYVVDFYKHVGTIKCANASSMRDARARANACQQAYQPLARHVFGNPAVAMKTRILLAQSLCFSRLLFGTETWQRYKGPEVAVLNAQRMRVLRRIAQCPRYQAENNLSDRDVCEMLGVHSTRAELRCQRLMAIASATSEKAPDILRALLKKSNSNSPMRKQTLEDLLWLREKNRDMNAWPSPSVAPEPWVELLADKKRLAYLCREAVDYGDVSTGGSEKPQYDKDGRAPAGALACDECLGDSPPLFWSKAALTMHKMKRHEYSPCWTFHS